MLEFFSTNSLSWEDLEYGQEGLCNVHYGLIHKGLPTLVNVDEFDLPIIKEKSIKNFTLCVEGDVAFADASEDVKDVAKVIEFFNCGNKEIVCGLHTIHGRDKMHITIKGFKGFAFSASAFRKQIHRLAQGTKVFSISTRNFSESYISIPSKQEQSKIVDLLKLIDWRISTQSKIIEELETLIKGIREKLFARTLAFKQDDGKQFPNWEARKMSEIADFYSGGTPQTFKKEYFNGDVPFIRSGEINASDTELFITELGLKNSSAKRVKKGDILLALYGATSGDVSISKLNGAINQAVLCIKSHHSHYFIYSFFKLRRDYIKQIFLQGGQGNLSADIVKGLKILIPNLKEQSKIGECLLALSDRVDVEKAILEGYHSERKYFLQTLFF